MQYDFEKIDKERMKLYIFIRKQGQILKDFFDEFSGLDQFFYDIEYIQLWQSVCKKIIDKEITIAEAKKVIESATHEERHPSSGLISKS